MSDKTIEKFWHNGPKAAALTKRLDEYIGEKVLHGGHTLLYRQFSPIRDRWEYTVYFKINGYKMRADFEVDADKVESLTDDELLNLMLLAVLDTMLWVCETSEIKINPGPGAPV